MILRRSNRSTMTPPSVREEEPGEHPRPHDEAERGGRVVRTARAVMREDREEPDPVAQAREHLRDPEPEERLGAEEPERLRRDRVLLARRDERCRVGARTAVRSGPAIPARAVRASVAVTASERLERRGVGRPSSPSPSSRRRWFPSSRRGVVPVVAFFADFFLAVASSWPVLAVFLAAFFAGPLRLPARAGGRPPPRR